MTVHPSYFTRADCDLATFEALIAQRLSNEDVPEAAEVLSGIPVYADFADALEAPESRKVLMAEWAWVLGQGPGVLVLRNAQPDLGTIDAASALYRRIIAEEKAAGAEGADHFATAGANDRIWNSLQKLCLADPDLFARYFGTPALAAAAEAWLGPGFQMTAQINLVHPGGAAQDAHRDYHLGFQTEAVAAAFPAHAHHLSAALTLQGGLAHCDMTVESGPTKLLPWSQLFPAGYLAYRDAAFRDVFERACVQLPMNKGDALFFNPALFHAAGENRTQDVERMVNLFQVSSPFGRAMESLDRTAMCRALFPALKQVRADGTLSASQIAAVIACAAEGYAFPTNLDTDPPSGGLAPETQAALLSRAVAEDWSEADLNAALSRQDARRRA